MRALFLIVASTLGTDLHLPREMMKRGMDDGDQCHSALTRHLQGCHVVKESVLEGSHEVCEFGGSGREE